jgi:hypothetical protein
MFHIGIRVAAILCGYNPSAKDGNLLSMCLILSSFGKILLLVMVIWDYGNLDPSFLINIFVIFSNICAVNGIKDIDAGLLRKGLAVTIFVILIGILGKLATQRIALYILPEFGDLIFSS